jgi:hypothetical protein
VSYRPYDWEREGALEPRPRSFPPIVGSGRGYVMGEEADLWMGFEIVVDSGLDPGSFELRWEDGEPRVIRATPQQFFALEPDR